jgi:flagellin-like protein
MKNKTFPKLNTPQHMVCQIRTSKKGISPVIATVILVAVAITVSISVAYWMGGISSLYTRLEKVEISSIAVSKDAATGNYTITMATRNTGSADATIDSCFINGKSFDDSSFTDKVYVRSSTGTWYSSSPLSIALASGGSATIIIRIRPANQISKVTVAPFTVGTTLDLKIHTAAGKDYPQMITLT